ncbi:MAG: leucine-rich repeat domain-containing protein [Clostridia bacterium]|nr:leucine-rich repeat domain-containing protein [Clostridia bacterium]
MSRINRENLFSPYTGGEPYVHVICAKEDFKRIYNVIRRLDQVGYNIWYDEDVLSADSGNAEKSMKNLESDKCRAVLLLYSPNCDKSLGIQNEIATAVKNGKLFICGVLDKKSDLPDIFDRYGNKQVTEDMNKLPDLLPEECRKGSVSEEEQPDEQVNFLTEVDAEGVHIKRFFGSESKVEIPVQIGGKPVKSIDNFAFAAKYPLVVTIPSSVSKIALSAFSFNNDNVTIVCPENSAAHRFARAEKVKYEISGFDTAVEEIKETNVKASKVQPLNLPKNLDLQKEYTEPFAYVSFARHDTEKVRPILERLCSLGYRLYVADRTKNLAKSKIAQAAVFMILISENTYYDDYVVNEELPCLNDKSGLYYSVCIDDKLTIPEGFRSQRVNKKTINRTDYPDFDRFFTALCEPLAICRSEGEFSSSDFDFATAKQGSVLVKYNGYSTRPEIPTSYMHLPVIEIGEFAFSGCDFLEQIIVPEGVVSIGGFAFSGCKALKTVVLPNSLRQMGSFVFSGCTSLESIVLPDGIEETGTNIFDACSALTSVSMPADLKEMSWYFFNNCTSLRDVDIADDTQVIGDFAFAGCTALNTVEMPARIKNIGKNAFKGCNHATLLSRKKGYAKRYAKRSGLDFKCTKKKGGAGKVIGVLAAIIAALAGGAAAVQLTNLYDVLGFIKDLF